MDTITFWLTIALLYFALAVITPVIAYFANKYVESWTEEAGLRWSMVDEKTGKVTGRESFFKPILKYLTWMMVIDIIVFGIAVFVALVEAGVINFGCE